MYVGGGTPTALSINQLERLLKAIRDTHQQDTLNPNKY